MNTARLHTPFEVKARNDDARTFEGLAAAYTLDTGGDLIKPGAFKKWLADWKSSGRVVPLMDMHPERFSSSPSVIRHTLGKLVEAYDTDDGLWAKFRVAKTAAGNDLMELLRDGMVEGLSIGYRAKARTVGGIRELLEVNIGEVSIVTFGMNGDTLIDLASVKSRLAIMDPDTLSDNDRSELRRLASRIGTLLRPKSAPPADEAADAADVDEQQPPPPDAPPDEADAPKARDADDMESKALLQRIQNIIGRTE